MIAGASSNQNIGAVKCFPECLPARRRIVTIRGTSWKREITAMRRSTIQFAWRESQPAEGFETGVSLHSHTMHSQECLSFLPRHLHRAPGISQVVSYYERVRGVDFARAWWTP